MKAKMSLCENRNCLSPQLIISKKIKEENTNLKISHSSLALSHKVHKANLIRRYNCIIGKLSSRVKPCLLRNTQPVSLKEIKPKSLTSKHRTEDDPTAATKDAC